ncbi:CRISPR-associated endonuclease Cas2 [Sulfurimonas sp. SWIR-19]|uniref:CRISPR-associated endonuclease Cas2 n=1 Tax=Sulfurimonas sp. SWIR-19 TaxID=2878390 RepID=UPI001CF17A3B|nr:CRISPR-associated endonuclease Cas2 [Sulfurimonas sp. SWIR-19]UCN01259.1 CRISPR-associated endonuclease Cas2 [Sulfurimonas sp. SWIR-19]
MKYVISYDISNDKRRTKLATLLDKYGTRVNYSVYECEFNQAKFDKLLYEIELKKLINKKYDSLRFYFIHEKAMKRSFEFARRADPFVYEEMTL